MPTTSADREQLAEWLRDLFAADATKVGLSAVIMLSLLPFTWVDRAAPVFFGIFAIELTLRVLVLRQELRRRSVNRAEVAVLAFDALATLSFLPLESMVGGIRYLRIFRLTRMLLLLSYWSAIVRDIWVIVMKRERRYQLVFVACLVVMLSFASAILVAHFNTLGVDFNEDGQKDNDGGFWMVAWWSFRQMQDSGHLLTTPSLSLVFLVSVVLSLSGVFVVAFLIGIGTSVVEELVQEGRHRRIGLRRHSVIANLGAHSRVLVAHLVQYYTKAFRSPRIVTMGPAPTRYDYMYEDALRRVRYRQGKPLSQHDLAKVDADRAVRVILLGGNDADRSDAEVIAQVLAVREANAAGWIYAELFQGQNVQAALTAGGPRTVPVMASRLGALLLADIIADPGVERIYRELLSSESDEIYTCLFEWGQLQGHTPPSGALIPFEQLLERGHRAHGVVLLGYLVEDEASTAGFSTVLNPVAGGEPDPAAPDVRRLRGFCGIAPHFGKLKELVLSLPDVARPEPAPPDAPVPRLRLDPARGAFRHVLVFGAHAGLADLCQALATFSEAVQITIVLPSEAHRVELLARLVSLSAGDEPAPPTPGRGTEHVTFVDRGGGRLDGVTPGGEHPRARVQLVVGDWADQGMLAPHRPAPFHVAEVDVVLFTYCQGDEDPDARTAVGLLKLMSLREHQPDRFHPALRVLAEVQRAETARLLERRFPASHAESAPAKSGVTVLPAESVRNAFLAQAVFVPGIGEIYDELLSARGQEICRLAVFGPVAPETQLTFGQLLRTLPRRDGVVPLAIELQQESEAPLRLVFNPDSRSPEYRFLASELRAVYVLADADRLREHPSPTSDDPPTAPLL
ncbi:MAG: hypothetical protein IT371_07085 [Deltaproteobacteria bacterium]|nr:hypothetical protein [Deltaproteobacteria bacterium]